MAESENLLMLEFLTWVSTRPRTYTDAMAAWQSSCPRHTIWENAIIEGYVDLDRQANLPDPELTLTPRGRALLNGNNDHH